MGKRGKARKKEARRAAHERISVVIPTVAQTETVRARVTAIQAGLGDPSPEIIIVDDASDAPVQDYLRSLAKELGIEAILRSERGGFSRAVNEGIRRCTSDYVVIMHNDVIVEPESLRRLARVAQADPSVAVAGARLSGPDGRLLQAGLEFDLQSELGVRPRLAGVPRDSFLAIQQDVVPAVSFALALVRASAFETLGVLDERLYLGMEDVDFCLRAAQRGLHVVYCPRCIARHEQGLSRVELLGEMGPSELKKHLDGLAAFFEKWANADPSDNSDLARFQEHARAWLAAESDMASTVVTE